MEAIVCPRHGESKHDPFTGECKKCLAVTPRCAGSAGGCSGLGDLDPAAHDPHECLLGEEVQCSPDSPST